MSYSEFIREIISQTGISQILQIAVEDNSILNIENPSIDTTGTDWLERVPFNTQFDIIAGEFPLRPERVQYELPGHNVPIEIDRIWIKISKACELLNESGIGIFLANQLDFSRPATRNIVNLLRSRGYQITGIVNYYDPAASKLTRIKQPVIFLIRKETDDNVFLGEFNESSDVHQLVSNFLAKKPGENLLDNGILCPSVEIQHFEKIRLQQAYTALNSEYKEYPFIPISDLIEEHHVIHRDGFHAANKRALYIPIMGLFRASISTTLPENLRSHRNFVQVILNDKVLPEYLNIFFESKIGKIIHLLMYRYTTNIIRGRVPEMLATMIPVPDLDKQHKIVKVRQKLMFLQSRVDNYSEAFSSNPTELPVTLAEIDSIIEIIN